VQDDEQTPAEERVIALRDMVGLGGYVVGSVVLGTVVGLLVDDAWDVSPLGIVLGLAVGIVLAVVGSCVRIATFLRR
jgi:F0F1-type ATP synthase assembly protein I